MKQDLLTRWCELCKRIGVHSTPEPAFDDLVQRYAEPHRAYHTLVHIQDGLWHFDLTRTLAEHVDEVELALWCHDVIYDPHAADNEEQSAAWARSLLKESDVSVDVIERIHALILVTQHQAIPHWPDAALLVDIDLSIFGRSSEAFDRYEAAIRQEYHSVPEQTYCEARIKVLESFLARAAIYQTAWYCKHYEAPGRQNVARTIERLRTASSLF